MSQKAFQFGADSGITGEFIVRQAATQLFQDINDINSLVTTMQYTMSPQILSGSVKPLYPLDFSSGDTEKQGLKEIITATLIGHEYRNLINIENGGNWDSEDFVLMNCQQMFEDRIKYLFLVDTDVSTSH